MSITNGIGIFKYKGRLKKRIQTAFDVFKSTVFASHYIELIILLFSV
ncbi:hypothetical protein [Neisseria montereyensis]|nr:hypothetical protein [Neisseria montereyensis]